MFVRPARPDDSELFTAWYSSHPSFDPTVITYAHTYVLCVYKKDRIIGFMPVQTLSFVSSQVLDSLVMSPDATDLEIAEGMRELVKHAITLGYLKDCGEIYFIGDHPETNKIAERIFTKVDFPVYRLKLEDLE
jgi:hypothetical protein